MREVVKRIFAAEDPTSPLSDDEAVLKLREEGLVEVDSYNITLTEKGDAFVTGASNHE